MTRDEAMDILWDALVNLGYAYKNRMYHMTEAGLKWFEKQTGVIVREEN